MVEYSMSIENIILDCKLCGELPKLTCNSIKTGKSRLLVLGESPAKDGWIVSGKAFYNSENKLQATGKNLQKLLELCNLNIDDINFTECCKCVIEDRKTLRQCIKNCRPILFNQLEDFDCDIILPMGQYPTEAILGIKINKLKDYVGKEFFTSIGEKRKLVIPIYHTSPANPLCLKGNVPIFEKVKYYLTAYELKKFCTKSSCYPPLQTKWKPTNPFCGHCAIISLYMNEKFGGKIKRAKYDDGQTHYWNEIDGHDYDFTAEQFSSRQNFSEIEYRTKVEMLSSNEFATRYQNFLKLLGEKTK